MIFQIVFYLLYAIFNYFMLKTQVKIVHRSSDLRDCSLWGSSVHGILQARVLEWVAISDDMILNIENTIKNIKKTIRNKK